MFFYFVVLLVNFQLESIIEFSDEVKTSLDANIFYLCLLLQSLTPTNLKLHTKNIHCYTEPADRH